MPNISIQLPLVEADHSVEVCVTINGQKKRYNYRIEIFPWSACRDGKEKADCLRRVIDHYDQAWQLVQIGEANDREVTLMFKQLPQE